HNELPPLVNPDIARDYIYVDDVVNAYWLAATQPSQEPGAIYNIGTGIQTSLREVVEVARSALNISVEPQWGSMPERQWDTTRWVANSQKASAVLGWEVHYTFRQGFRHMVDWLRLNPTETP